MQTQQVVLNDLLTEFSNSINCDFEKLKAALESVSPLSGKSCYLLDTNILTFLYHNSSNLNVLRHGFSYGDLLLLPRIILEEWSCNYTTVQHFASKFKPFFEQLSKHFKIHVIDFEDILKLLDLMGNSGDSINKLKSIASEAVRINNQMAAAIREIPDKLDPIEQVNRICSILTGSGKNAGERYLNVYGLLLVKLDCHCVIVCGNDVQGIHGYFCTHKRNDGLHKEIILIFEEEYEEEFLQRYKICSSDVIILNAIKSGRLTKQEISDIVASRKVTKTESRKVIYSRKGMPENDIISNTNFETWAIQDELEIAF